MSITEIRKEVCARAILMMRRDHLDRAYAFRLAWRLVKEAAKERVGKITASDLKPGDVVRFEFGDDGHFVTATVVSKEDAPSHCKVRVRYWDGREFDVCAKPSELFEKA